MEANFFRCLARELIPRLEGARVEKIYNPAPDVWTLKVRTVGGASFLLLRACPRRGLLFLTGEKPANPANPSARCMWFRKRVEDRRLFAGRADWPSRSLALSLTPDERGPWLVLSSAAAPELLDTLPEGFGAEPDWPAAEDALADETWRAHPQLTPPLRRFLAAMPEARRPAVLDAVRRGGCLQFFLYSGDPAQVLAWRLPDELRGVREEDVHSSALEAADALGRRELFPYLTALAESGEREALKTERGKVERSLASVDKDQARLEGLVELGRQGEALRGALYALDKEAKLSSVEIPGPDGEPVRLELDGKLTVAENMEHFFKLAAKGRRGLEFVRSRREELTRRLVGLKGGQLPVEVLERLERDGNKSRKVRQMPGPLPRGLAAFRTEDGFMVYRGKSAQANHDLVRKVASPFDLWFHARGGAGSHVVLRLDYPDQEVPRRSLEQAAILAGLRSFATGNARADVICALVRHVHAVKGAGPGKVTVDREFAALSVALDPSLEERLSLGAS